MDEVIASFEEKFLPFVNITIINNDNNNNNNNK